MAKLSAEELAAIVGTKVRLEKRGRDWWGLCAFHNEKTASFHVYEANDGGRYKCFGCGAGGDSIDWLRAVEHKSYREAAGAQPNRSPEVNLERERRRHLDADWNEQLDRQPDLPPEARDFLEPEDLATKLRRRLSR